VSDPDARAGESDRRQNALMMAARSGRANCARLLMAVSDQSMTDLSGYTALMIAIERQQSACVDLLANAEGCRLPEGKGFSPLMLAAQTNDASSARAVLAFEDFERRDFRGMTALGVASETGALEVLKLLWPHSDWRRAGPSGFTALGFAYGRKRFECLDWMASQLPPDEQDALWGSIMQGQPPLPPADQIWDWSPQPLTDNDLRKMLPATAAIRRARLDADAMRKAIEEVASSPRGAEAEEGRGDASKGRSGSAAGESARRGAQRL